MSCAWSLYPQSQGNHWGQVLLILVVYRLLSPGQPVALAPGMVGAAPRVGGLLGLEAVVGDNLLYDCHDLLLEHKTALFDQSRGALARLFNVSFDVLLNDLMSTYFEITPEPRNPGSRANIRP